MERKDQSVYTKSSKHFQSDVASVATAAVAIEAENEMWLEIPTQPHMGPDGLRLFQTLLDASACFLEYGAGGSTRFAVNRSVPYIFAVESDRALARALRRVISQRRSDGHVKVLTCDIGETGKWGYPTNRDNSYRWPDYAFKIWRFIEEAGVLPDLALIDGRFRVACFLTCLIKMRPGAKILFDDYVGREKQYARVEAFIKPDSTHGVMAQFTVPSELPLADIAIALGHAVVVPE